MDKKRVFMFVPGTNPKEAKYYLNDNPAIIEEASFSTVALIKLQDKIYNRKPDLVLAFCTDKVKKEQWETIERNFKELDVKVECIPIPDGADESQLKEIIKIMLHSLPEDCYLTLDLTHGFRSCPIIFSVAVQYIKFLRKRIDIEGFYYGMFESKNEAGASPIVDMKVYLDLMEWIYAVRVFRDTRATSKLIKQFAENDTEASQKGIISNLRDFNKYYELAMPIKLGDTAVLLNEDLSVHLPQEFLYEIPLGKELVDEIAELVQDFSFLAKRQSGEIEELDIEELERQGRIVDIYFETGQINHAVGLMREWIISALLYYNGNRKKWREKKERREIEKQINKNGQESDIKERWERVRKLRNELHHHGIQETVDYNMDEEIQIIQGYWEALKDNISRPDYWVLGIGK